MDLIRRVQDRGPLHPDKERANSIARYLRSTGLYESVKVIGSKVDAVTVAAPPDLSIGSAEVPAAKAPEPSLDDLSSLLEDAPAASGSVAAD